MAATQLGMMAMGLVDIVMVGPLGTESLAAVSVGNSVFFALLILCLGVVQALDPLVAQAVGARDREAAGRHLWQGAWLAVFLGIPLTLLFIDCTWMFRLLAQEEAVSVLAGDYLAGRAYSILPFLVFAAGRSFLNGLGDTRPVMWVALGANAVNAAADWVLIYGNLGAPRLGVMGAGLATSIVRVCMLAAVFVLLARPHYAALRGRPAWPHLGHLRRIANVGLPIGGQLFLEVGLFATMSIFSGWLGARAQAAHQIALSLASFSFMAPLGLSMGATVRVGHAVGAGRLDAAERAGKVAIALGAAIMGTGAVFFLLFPRALSSIFSPEPEVLATSAVLVAIAGIFQVSDGVQVVATGCLRGAGDTRTPFWANALSHWALGVPLAWLLAFPGEMGVRGLWWGITASLTGVAVVETILFLRGGWRSLARLEAGPS
ncbi:MAG: MATE family efflux transporter [Deltaproteobacteria bacterium]|nr:MATE family efflux transporter [Deltaproteobacteria bacterium]